MFNEYSYILYYVVFHEQINGWMDGHYVTDECLYNTDKQLLKRLRTYCRNPTAVRSRQLQASHSIVQSFTQSFAELKRAKSHQVTCATESIFCSWKSFNLILDINALEAVEKRSRRLLKVFEKCLNFELYYLKPRLPKWRRMHCSHVKIQFITILIKNVMHLWRSV